MRDFIYAIKSGFWAVAIILASLPTGCQQEAFDTEKYESYVLYDCHLECLDWETEANASVVYANRTYNVTFCKVKGEPEDQFIYANIADLTPFSPSGWFVLQNPENYVDIWSEWTMRLSTHWGCPASSQAPSGSAGKDPGRKAGLWS